MAEEGSGFDPEAVRKEVRDTGFTAVDIEITAVGSIGRDEHRLLLELPHEPKRVLLIGGEKIASLEAEAVKMMGRIRIRGTLLPRQDERPVAMTVDWWEPLP